MKHNLVILGSGAAGLTAAIYACRSNLDPIVIEGLEPGGQLTITSDVENYPGFTNPIAGPTLMADMRAQAQRLGAKFIAGNVSSVKLGKKPFVIQTEREFLEVEVLIIATGACAQWLNIESETKLRGRGVSACATCDGFFYKGKEIAVVGGGDTAIEEAMFLTNFASKVTIVHRRDALRASKVMQERAFANPKIKFAWNSVVDEILDVSKNTVTGLRLKDTKTGKLNELPCEGVFIAIGHKPNTDIFKGRLDMDELGYIKTEKSSMTTNVKGVFAAGDCQDRVYRQAITAAGTGCMAAIDAERYLQALHK